jgi:hypothetical protein
MDIVSSDDARGDWDITLKRFGLYGFPSVCVNWSSVVDVLNPTAWVELRRER